VSDQSLAVHSGRGTKRGLGGTITLVDELAVWFTPHEMEVDDIISYHDV